MTQLYKSIKKQHVILKFITLACIAILFLYYFTFIIIKYRNVIEFYFLLHYSCSIHTKVIIFFVFTFYSYFLATLYTTYSIQYLYISYNNRLKTPYNNKKRSLNKRLENNLIRNKYYTFLKSENNNFVQYGRELIKALQEFRIYGAIISYIVGPVIVLYKFKPQAGIKISKITALTIDISRLLSIQSIRITIRPGENVVGIEISKKNRSFISFKKLLLSKEYKTTIAQLPIMLGKDISGDTIIADLSTMPHLLIAGTTGSGKSVSINTYILSILYSCHPYKCRFIMIDPKVLELSIYNNIPHLLAPVAIEPNEALVLLQWIVNEMKNRYKIMNIKKVRNIKAYNNFILKTDNEKFNIIKKNRKICLDILNISTFPYIVIIIDEIADLMVAGGKKIEYYIQRIAQMARASNIHLIIATQRPSVDVVTGVIKANFSSRISFYVTSKFDSRTILGEQGAEKLLGMGDLLYTSSQITMKRIHAAFINDFISINMISRIKQKLKVKRKQSYLII